MICERCGNETEGHGEGGRDYCTCCGADLGLRSIIQGFAELRAAGGDAWDDVDDPAAFIRDVCGG